MKSSNLCSKMQCSAWNDLISDVLWKLNNCMRVTFYRKSYKINTHSTKIINFRDCVKKITFIPNT